MGKRLRTVSALGQPSRWFTLIWLTCLVACERSAIWSHDAGRAFDAGAAPIYSFPRPLPDAGRLVLDASPNADTGGRTRWRRVDQFPSITDFSGLDRMMALARQPSGEPCLAMATTEGLFFGCLADTPSLDAGPLPDTSASPEAGAHGDREWQLERIAAHPNNAWIGAQLDVTIDPEGVPWVVARQMPERRTWLYVRADDAWRREEISVAHAGIDPQLHAHRDGAVSVLHGAQESASPPALVLSHRQSTGDWHHTPLIEAYDALPGHLHRSQLVGERFNVCSFDPGSQRITSGRTSWRLEPAGDGGAAPDAGLSDTPRPTLERVTTQPGGPFCGLDGDTMLMNESLLGAVVALRADAATAPTGHRGAFRVLRTQAGLVTLSRSGGLLQISRAGQPPTPLTGSHETGRPLALALDEDVLIAEDPQPDGTRALSRWRAQP